MLLLPNLIALQTNVGDAYDYDPSPALALDT